MQDSPGNASRAASSPARKERVKVLLYGLQRSGTNYLEAVLRRDYPVEFLNDPEQRASPRHKHFRLYDDKHLIPDPQYHNDLKVTGLTSLERALGSVPDFYIVLSKDPYSWLISYKNWARRVSWPSVDHHYIQEYNLFYGKWLELARDTSRIVFVRYIDLLRDRAAELKRMEYCLGIKRKFPRNLIPNWLRNINRGREFTGKRRSYYLKERYLDEYDLQELKQVNLLLDRRVVTGLGYEIRNAPLSQ